MQNRSDPVISEIDSQCCSSPALDYRYQTTPGNKRMCVSELIVVSCRNVMEVEMNAERTQRTNDSLKMSDRAYQKRRVFKAAGLQDMR